jgi:hypothetical protein
LRGALFAVAACHQWEREVATARRTQQSGIHVRLAARLGARSARNRRPAAHPGYCQVAGPIGHHWNKCRSALGGRPATSLRYELGPSRHALVNKQDSQVQRAEN